EPPPRSEEPRRVDEDDLGVALDGNAADAGASGLDLVGDDRDLGADHRVQQRRLAGVRLADQRHEARPAHASTSTCARSAPAAACWAARFEAASATAARPSARRASTENTGA